VSLGPKNVDRRSLGILPKGVTWTIALLPLVGGGPVASRRVRLLPEGQKAARQERPIDPEGLHLQGGIEETDEGMSSEKRRLEGVCRGGTIENLLLGKTPTNTPLPSGGGGTPLSRVWKVKKRLRSVVELRSTGKKLPRRGTALPLTGDCHRGEGEGSRAEPRRAEALRGKRTWIGTWEKSCRCRAVGGIRKKSFRGEGDSRKKLRRNF